MGAARATSRRKAADQQKGPAAVSPETREDPGAILRRIRIERGWTLADMSGRCGLPVSTLSKVENAKMSPSYDKLVRISAALEVDIAALLSSAERAADDGPGLVFPVGGRRSITPAGEGRCVETDQYAHLYPASDMLNKKLVPIIAELKARTIEEFGELLSHEGEEFAYVLEGSVLLYSNVYAPVLLHKGDSIYFDSRMGHAYLAAEPGRCVVMSICSAAQASPASAQDRANMSI
ncbi:MAG: XRE family transcriptional regulator [Sphingomonadales bacterium]|nr:MAG: XRE family transcriptional regulator [Sphingomonadales bacterium]TNF06071.1 MAG: XRE family transcriptional regulator [Sphingomonadales bacterium]